MTTHITSTIGLIGELAVKNYLEANYYWVSVTLSPDSRTKTDVEAAFASGYLWIIQVKTSITGDPSWPTSQEIQALNSRATRIGATPVIARVWLTYNQDSWFYNEIKFYSARTFQELRIR
jgi:hypothetical protein